MDANELKNFIIECLIKEDLYPKSNFNGVYIKSIKPNSLVKYDDNVLKFKGYRFKDNFDKRDIIVRFESPSDPSKWAEVSMRITDKLEVVGKPV